MHRRGHHGQRAPAMLPGDRPHSQRLRSRSENRVDENYGSWDSQHRCDVLQIRRIRDRPSAKRPCLTRDKHGIRDTAFHQCHTGQNTVERLGAHQSVRRSTHGEHSDRVDARRNRIPSDKWSRGSRCQLSVGNRNTEKGDYRSGNPEEWTETRHAQRGAGERRGKVEA